MTIASRRPRGDEGPSTDLPEERAAFRNQRVRFRNYSPPYGDKVTFDPRTPGKGIRPRGGVPSRKTGRVVSYWTPGEYAAIVLFEADIRILGYEERPERLLLRDGPSWFAYVPHFEVCLERRRAVVELSADGCPRTDRQACVAELARSYYAEQGTAFVELAHSAVRARPGATDALRLMRYLSVEPGVADLLRVTDVLGFGPRTVAEVEAASGVSHGHLFAMLRTGALRAAAPGRVGLDMPIMLPGSGHHP